MAAEKFQAPYLQAQQKLGPELNSFLSSIKSNAQFHYLELLSSYAQFVFSTESVIGAVSSQLEKVILTGPLPISSLRNDEGSRVGIPNQDFAVLSFGSVYDPADFPEMVDIIVKETKRKNLKLLVSSKKLSCTPFPSHVEVYPYLPIPRLLNRARVFFHHGGANTFSEALLKGCPQIIIPLATDQPIQAHYLVESGVGFAVNLPKGQPGEMSEIMDRVLDRSDVVHQRIKHMQQEYRRKNGAQRAIAMLKDIMVSQSSINVLDVA